MQKSYEVKITKQALNQMQDIVDYISSELLAPVAADRLLDKMEEVIKSLSLYPGKYALIEEEPWRSEGIHRMRAKNYYVYFWIDEDNAKVQVTSVIYVARDQATQLEFMEIE